MKRMLLLGLIAMAGMAVADTLNVQEIGVCPMYSHLLNCPIRDIKVSGNYLYCARSDSGIVIVDINDRTNPVIAGKARHGERAVSVALYGNLLWVSDLMCNLCLYDVTNRNSPCYAKCWYTASYNGDIILANEGTLLYQASVDSGVFMYNVSDTHNIYKYNVSRGAKATSLALSPTNHLYRNATLTTVYRLDRTYMGSLIGADTVTNPIYDIGVDSNYVYTINNSQLIIYSTATPKPVQVSSTFYGFSLELYPAIAKMNNLVAIVGSFGLIIYDVSNPAFPFVVGRLSGYGIKFSAVQIDSNGYFYCAAENGIYIYRLASAGVCNPSALTQSVKSVLIRNGIATITTNNPTKIDIIVYNVLGQFQGLMFDGIVNGETKINLRRRGMVSGQYFVVVRTEDAITVHKMLIVK